VWILPKNIGPLLQLSSAQVTQVSISDSSEQSRLCASSLLVRSKVSRLQTWSQKWKRDSLTSHLSGRILKPSLDRHFTAKWTSLWGASHVKDFQRPASDSETQILGISGLSSSSRSDSCSLNSASSRMSMVYSAPNSQAMDGTTHQEHPFCSMSAENWKGWVTAQRLGYSQRLKSARLTRESGCSSSQPGMAWPTCSTRDYKGESGSGRQERKGHPTDTLPNAMVVYGPQDPASSSSHGSRRESYSRTTLEGAGAEPQTGTESWPTPNVPGEHSIGAVSEWGGQKNPMRKDPKNHTAKLNPRWVETLMGLPIGWTMPSCTSPVTIESTSCVSLETELSLKLRESLSSRSQQGLESAWATPAALNIDESYYQRSGDKIYPGLAMQARDADWPTIRASDAEHGGPNQRTSGAARAI